MKTKINNENNTIKERYKQIHKAFHKQSNLIHKLEKIAKKQEYKDILKVINDYYGN